MLMNPLGRRGWLAALVIAPIVASGQGATPVAVPCRDTGCRLVFDWGGGQTAASIPPDRRYGSGDDFESKLRFSLAGRGFRLSDAITAGDVVILLRPRMTKAICDATPGMNTDRSCNTIDNVAVSFSGGDSTVKPPGARSITNSCGDAANRASMSQFGQYAAEFIAYLLEGDRKGERRPSPKC